MHKNEMIGNVGMECTEMHEHVETRTTVVASELAEEFQEYGGFASEKQYELFVKILERI